MQKKKSQGSFQMLDNVICGCTPISTVPNKDKADNHVDKGDVLFNSWFLRQLQLLFNHLFCHWEEGVLKVHTALVISKILKISRVSLPLAWLQILFQLEFLSAQPTSFLIFYE